MEEVIEQTESLSWIRTCCHGRNDERDFQPSRTVEKYRLDVPQVTMLAHGLKQRGLDIKEGILTTNELIEALEKAGDWRQNQKKTYVGHAETVVKKEKKRIQY